MADRESGGRPRMKIAITGGTGFVGTHLASQFRSLGHFVTVFGRDEPTCLDGVDLLIHAAWQMHGDTTMNVKGSSALFAAAKAAKVPGILFVSSMSAFEGCRSRYGTEKLAVEKIAASIGGVSVRLGFVCDDSDRGLSGSLKKLARLPVIPLPVGASALYALRAEHLAPALLKILEHSPHEPVTLAHPQPLTLAAMMRFFAQGQGNRPVLLPVPWRALWLPLRAAEAAGIGLRFRSDSLVSLMNQNPRPDFSRLREWDIQITPFLAGKNDSL